LDIEFIFLLSVIGCLSLCTLYFSVKKSRLLVTIFQVVLLILVYGQIIWIAIKFNTENAQILQIGYNNVLYGDAITVAVMFLFFQLALFFLILLIPSVKARVPIISNKLYVINSTVENLLLGFIGFVIPILMVYNAGGMKFFTSPGAMIPGQTLLIILAGFLKWGVLNRLAYNLPQTLMTISCFILYVLLALFTSRFLTVFALLQVLLYFNYFSKPVSFWLLSKYLFGAFIVIIVFGVYRDFSSNIDIDGMSFSFIFSSMFDYSNHIFDWFYTLNTEVFVGVANALNEIRNFQSLDYLSSELKSVTLLFPNFIKTDPNFIIADLIQYLDSISSVSYSVIPSGFERYYFGLKGFGFFLYSLMLLIFLWSCERSFSRSGNTWGAVFSIQSINAIRGSLLGVVLFFGLADYIAALVFKSLMRYRVEKNYN
jgi:hypothetical protein